MNDPLVHCPFELSHVVKQSRFQAHLIKCKKNHPNSKLEPCPYNATEYIHPDDLVEHLKVCKNAVLLEGLKYDAERLQENYLDAPFHIPKPKAESEDFEHGEIQVDYHDERILERSVSRMSLNSSYSNDPHENDDEVDDIIPFDIGERTSLDLASRSSMFRSIGRGVSMVGLISVWSEADETDYGKYEVRSKVGHNVQLPSSPSSKFPDTQGAESAAPIPAQRSNNSHVELPKAEFVDCSSDEDECSSDSTIISTQQVKTPPKLSQQVGLKSEPGGFPRLLSDSDDDDYSTAIADREIATVFRENSPFASTYISSGSQNGDSKMSESSAGQSSFLSLIRANKFQNDVIVRSKEMTMHYGQKKPSYRGGRGRPGQFPQQQPMGSDKRRNRNESIGMQHHRSVNYDDSTVSFQNPNRQSWPNSQDQSPNQYQSNQDGFVSKYHGSNQSSQNRYPSEQRGRGSYNKAVGRGSQRTTFEGGDFSTMKSVGRGITPFNADNNEYGDLISSGNYHSQKNFGSNRGPFRQVSEEGDSYVNKGNYHGQGDFVSNRGFSSQRNFRGRGNSHYDHSDSRGKYHNNNDTVGKRGSFNQGNSFDRVDFYDGNTIGRGQSRNQWKSAQQQPGGVPNSRKPLGRGSLLSNLGNGDGEVQSVGRGKILSQVSMQQFPPYPQSRKDFNKKGAFANPYIDADNFRGKSTSEISHDSFQAIYNSFKDLQIVDYCPESSSTGKNIPTVPVPIAKVPMFGGFAPIPSSSSSSAPPNNPNDPGACTLSKSKKKNLKKEQKKKEKQLSSEPSSVDLSTEPEAKSKCSSQSHTESSITILNKSMDPKKYFGSDDYNSFEPKQDDTLNEPKHMNDAQSHAKLTKSKVRFQDKFLNKKRDNFEMYDKFYSQVSSFCNLNEQDGTEYGCGVGNQSTLSPKAGEFGKNLEREKPVSLQKRYASVNFIQVSQKPVQSLPQNNMSSSACVSSNVSFASLHTPQKPKSPRRYDRLSETASYKFVFRQINRKQTALNRKNKPLSKKGKKSFITPTVTSSSTSVSNETSDGQSIPQTNVFSRKGAETQQYPSDFHFMNNNFGSTGKRPNFKPQVLSRDFEKSWAGNEMSLWKPSSLVNKNKTSFSNKFSSAQNEMPFQYENSFTNPDESSFHNRNAYFNPEDEAYWNSKSGSMINSSATPSYNSFPNFQVRQQTNFTDAKNLHPKKVSFVVSKKKANFNQRKPFNKNVGASGWQPKPRFRNSQSFLSSLVPSNWDTPKAFGPSNSCHLEYASKTPLSFDPFDLT